MPTIYIYIPPVTIVGKSSTDQGSDKDVDKRGSSIKSLEETTVQDIGHIYA
jgi:hypothetical protein